MKNVIFGFVGLLMVLSVSAESAERGRWHLTVGPAWRENVKSRITGAATAAPVGASGVSYDKDVSDRSTWGTLVEKQDPSYGAVMGKDRLWAVEATRTETIATPGAGRFDADASNDDSPLGFNLAAGYDFYQGEMFSVGLNLRFAAFFDMKASASGAVDSGSIRTIVLKDYFLFENPPYPSKPILPTSTPNAEPYEPYREAVSDTTSAGAGSRYVSARLESDLYQIALGPRLTWHALKWLDVYGGVDAIINFAAMDFKADGASTSDVETLLGFGGSIGLDAYLTDWLGLYAQVGYEWIDDAEVSAGGIDGEADFSSLVVSVGVVLTF